MRLVIFETSKLGACRGKGGNAEGKDTQGLKKKSFFLIMLLGSVNEAGLLEPEIGAIL